MTVPTTSWDETAPAGATAVSAGDDRIREMKTQIREVINVDHDFPSSGQATDNGQHKQVTLQEQADLGTGAVGTTILGNQTVAGKGELCYVDEDDNTIQLTKAGALNVLDNAIVTAKILDANVTEGKIATGAVTADKIGAGAVVEAKIGDLAVSTGKIAAAAVTAAKMGSTFGEYVDQGGGAFNVTRSGTASADSMIFGYCTTDQSGTANYLECLIGTTVVQRATPLLNSSVPFCFPVRKGDSWSVSCVTSHVYLAACYLMPVGV